MESKARGAETPELKFNLVTLLNQLNHLRSQVESYNSEIERYSQDPFYRRQVKALCAYRGISTLTAMTFITEIGDVRRFSHPKKLSSYAGLDIAEYSSGGREKKFGITKMGNRRIRTAAVEAVQRVYLKPHISKRLRSLREGVPTQFTDIADRCMNRLYKKSRNLFATGKPRNKVKVACARELLCFVWETLTAVETDLAGGQGEVRFTEAGIG
jgi:transposase